MTIREAKLSDYRELMKLYNLFTESKKYTDLDNDSFKFALTDSKIYVYLAEDRNKLVGFATFSVRNVVRYPQPIIQLEELFVQETFRKTGIGRQFIDIMEQKAKELNCCSAYIESRNDKKIAHEIYQKLGYKKDGYYFKKVF